MNRDHIHPRGAGLQAHPHVAHVPTVPFVGGARWRLVARGLLVALLLVCVGPGALIDLGLRWLGLRWAPVFTLLWGTGGLLLVGVAWTRFELKAAEARTAQRRKEG